jgi:hypothetical protein
MLRSLSFSQPIMQELLYGWQFRDPAKDTRTELKDVAEQQSEVIDLM